MFVGNSGKPFYYAARVTRRRVVNTEVQKSAPTPFWDGSQIRRNPFQFCTFADTLLRQAGCDCFSSELLPFATVYSVVICHEVPDKRTRERTGERTRELGLLPDSCSQTVHGCDGNVGGVRAIGGGKRQRGLNRPRETRVRAHVPKRRHAPWPRGGLRRSGRTGSHQKAQLTRYELLSSGRV